MARASAVSWVVRASLLLGAASGHRAHLDASALVEESATEGLPPRLMAPLLAAAAASGFVPSSPMYTGTQLGGASSIHPMRADQEKARGLFPSKPAHMSPGHPDQDALVRSAAGLAEPAIDAAEDVAAKVVEEHNELAAADAEVQGGEGQEEFQEEVKERSRRPRSIMLPDQAGISASRRPVPVTSFTGPRRKMPAPQYEREHRVADMWPDQAKIFSAKRRPTPSSRFALLVGRKRRSVPAKRRPTPSPPPRDEAEPESDDDGWAVPFAHTSADSVPGEKQAQPNRKSTASAKRKPTPSPRPADDEEDLSDDEGWVVPFAPEEEQAEVMEYEEELEEEEEEEEYIEQAQAENLGAPLLPDQDYIFSAKRRPGPVSRFSDDMAPGNPFSTVSSAHLSGMVARNDQEHIVSAKRRPPPSSTYLDRLIPKKFPLDQEGLPEPKPTLGPLNPDQQDIFSAKRRSAPSSRLVLPATSMQSEGKDTAPAKRKAISSWRLASDDEDEDISDDEGWAAPFAQTEGVHAVLGEDTEVEASVRPDQEGIFSAKRRPPPISRFLDDLAPGGMFSSSKLGAGVPTKPDQEDIFSAKRRSLPSSRFRSGAAPTASHDFGLAQARIRDQASGHTRHLQSAIIEPRSSRGVAPAAKAGAPKTTPRRLVPSDSKSEEKARAEQKEQDDAPSDGAVPWNARFATIKPLPVRSETMGSVSPAPANVAPQRFYSKQAAPQKTAPAAKAAPPKMAPARPMPSTDKSPVQAAPAKQEEKKGETPPDDAPKLSAKFATIKPLPVRGEAASASSGPAAAAPQRFYSNQAAPQTTAPAAKAAPPKMAPARPMPSAEKPPVQAPVEQKVEEEQGEAPSDEALPWNARFATIKPLPIRSETMGSVSPSPANVAPQRFYSKQAAPQKTAPAAKAAPPKAAPSLPLSTGDTSKLQAPAARKEEEEEEEQEHFQAADETPQPSAKFATIKPLPVRGEAQAAPTPPRAAQRSLVPNGDTTQRNAPAAKAALAKAVMAAEAEEEEEEQQEEEGEKVFGESVPWNARFATIKPLPIHGEAQASNSAPRTSVASVKRFAPNEEVPQGKAPAPPPPTKWPMLELLTKTGLKPRRRAVPMISEAAATRHAAAPSPSSRRGESVSARSDKPVPKNGVRPVTSLGRVPSGPRQATLPNLWMEKIAPGSLRYVQERGSKRLGYARLAEQPDVEVMFTMWDSKDEKTFRHLTMSELLHEDGFAPMVYNSVTLSSLTIVMSESPGERTLGRLIEEGMKQKKQTKSTLVLPLGRSLPLMVDLLQSLVPMAARGIAIGDLSADTLYLADAESHVMISDLGMACMLEIESDFPCLGEACSPLRQAPEMTHGLPNSVANNIWQAGLIYSSLLLGGILHSSVLKVDVSSPEGRYQVQEYMREQFSIEEVPGFAKLAEEHSDIAEMIQGMLARDPEERLTAVQALELARKAAWARDIDIELGEHQAPEHW